MKSWLQRVVITQRNFVIATVLFGAMAYASLAAAELKPLNLTAVDRADLTRAQVYLNSITTLQSRFLQASTTGSYAEGTLTLSRPGKLRLEYDPPVQMLIVADGTWLIYKDLELDQISYLPLNSTPAGIIVREEMSFFGDDMHVVKIERGPGVLGITVTGQEPGEGSMTLVFADKPMALKKWIVIDPQGVKTSVSLLSSRYGIAVDKKLFIVKQPESLGPTDK